MILRPTSLVPPRPVSEEEIIHRQYGRRMFRQNYQYPDGRIKEFVLFGASTTPIWVLPVTADNRVVAVRQFRHGVNEFIVEIPGGNPKAGQTPEDVAEAELVEETGYRPGGLRQLGGPLYIDPPSFRVSAIAMLAFDCERIGAPNPDKTEIIEVLTFGIAEWLQMCEHGAVADCKSVAVTMRALPFLGLALQ